MIDNDRVARAYKFADFAHHGQYRKWGTTKMPYLTHPNRVANRVMELRYCTTEMAEAALLHDVMEDCEVERKTLVNLFGKRVGDYVAWLSNTSKQDLPHGATRAERKKYDRDLLKIAPKEVKVIKYCDRIENLIDVIDTAPNPEWANIYADESLLLHNESLLDENTDISLQNDLIYLIGRVKEKYGSLTNTHRT